MLTWELVRHSENNLGDMDQNFCWRGCVLKLRSPRLVSSSVYLAATGLHVSNNRNFGPLVLLLLLFFITIIIIIITHPRNTAHLIIYSVFSPVWSSSRFFDIFDRQPVAFELSLSIHNTSVSWGFIIANNWGLSFILGNAGEGVWVHDLHLVGVS